MSDILLTDVQARVIGSMIEKQLTTPANYPLTPNSVKVACNQKSNRDPVVEFDDDQIFDTLKALEKLGCVESGLLDYTRTIKYKQTFTKLLGLDKAETAVVTELLLRGPQTPGELRARGERLHPFADLAEVEATLGKLKERGMVTLLERLPGTKEPRWAHLFCGKPVVPSTPASVGPPRAEGRVELLERQVHALEDQLRALDERVRILEGQGR